MHIYIHIHILYKYGVKAYIYDGKFLFVLKEHSVGANLRSASKQFHSLGASMLNDISPDFEYALLHG